LHGPVPLIKGVILDACPILHNYVKQLQKLTGYIPCGINRALCEKTHPGNGSAQGELGDDFVYGAPAVG
jgi:hypothetical protein